ncbi:cytochrome c551 [Lentibacillus saliphilus]|uniref:cytochrome c551 n=1 Tax=Lentibacillus saliphilus TaxID=2737028 RepID=UPI001C30FA7F|nr:cytochrome c [Lentibacillus saliphilus]
MKKWLIALLLGIVLTLGACGGGNDNSSGGEVSEADSIYKSNCASCHGGDLGGGMGPDLTSIGSKYSKDDIIDIIQNGKGSMQPIKGVTDEEADTLASWLANKK